MIYIGIGSNLGNRMHFLRQAVELLRKENCLRNIVCSIVLETKCILPSGAPETWDKNFLNMVVAGNTDLQPEVMFYILKKIEHLLGRSNAYEKWSPRVIDLDILLWDSYCVDTKQLKIPHPELKNRDFLLHLLFMMNAKNIENSHLYKDYKNSFLSSYALFPKFIGIVNITNNSFSDGGLYNEPHKAVKHTMRLIQEGASVVDIGAQSTKPGAKMQENPEIEYAQLAPVLGELEPLIQRDKLAISIDTCHSHVVRKVLENHTISCINTISVDSFDDETLSLIAQKECFFCITHATDVPPKQHTSLPNTLPPIEIVRQWIKIRIDHLVRLGFKEENLIIDPGIGFGKSLYQNLNIIRCIGDLRLLNIPILVGHSRKGYINAITNKDPPDRDIETIATSILLKEKVDYLRVHDVARHMHFFTMHQALLCGTLKKENTDVNDNKTT